MLTVHFCFIVLSVFSFIGRVILAQWQSPLLQHKLCKILPHVLDTLLLLSGLVLVMQGGWLHAEYGWIISKLAILVVYIGCGVVCMRSTGWLRWLSFSAALASIALIFVIAITKHGFF